jgi:hypothetical protein
MFPSVCIWKSTSANASLNPPLNLQKGEYACAVTPETGSTTVVGVHDAPADIVAWLAGCGVAAAWPAVPVAPAVAAQASTMAVSSLIGLRGDVRTVLAAIS